MSDAGFDPVEVFAVLERHGVRFVVIGGVGARLFGSPTVTRDTDICYERSPENLARLADALVDLRVRLRGVDDDVPFVLDARTLAGGDHFTFTSRAGDFDVLGTPAGVEGYDELDRDAVAFDLGEVTVRVASIDDLIRMKRAAGRPKDLIEVEVLAAVRDERDAQSIRSDADVDPSAE
jgi:hypothetical protein